MNYYFDIKTQRSDGSLGDEYGVSLRDQPDYTTALSKAIAVAGPAFDKGCIILSLTSCVMGNAAPARPA